MDILPIIKKRSSIRKYTDKSIPKEVLDKIIEAGIWGPSIPSFLRIQPWQFIVITDSAKIKGICEIISEKARHSESGSMCC